MIIGCHIKPGDAEGEMERLEKVYEVAKEKFGNEVVSTVSTIFFLVDAISCFAVVDLFHSELLSWCDVFLTFEVPILNDFSCNRRQKQTARIGLPT